MRGCDGSAVLTAKDQLGFLDDALDVDGGLLDLGGDETARGEHEIRVGLAVAVLEVEPPEQDGRRGDGHLPQLQPLAQLLDEVGEPYAETVQLPGGGVARVRVARRLQMRASDEPVPRVRRRPKVGRHGVVFEC